MPNYVDSDNLENDWFCWQIARSVPDLEIYRLLGCLWTKVDDEVQDPYHDARIHVIPFGRGMVQFRSIRGELEDVRLPLER